MGSSAVSPAGETGMGSDCTRHHIQLPALSPENTSSTRSQSSPVPSMGPATVTTHGKLPETLGASALWRCQSWRAGDTKPVHKDFARLGLWEIILGTSTCPMVYREAENPGMNPGLILLGRKHCPFPAPMRCLTAATNVRAGEPPLLGAIQDVSEKKRTEQKMRQGWGHHRGSP